MDFIEFLKSGNEGYHNRIEFDGKIFKKENDTSSVGVKYELYSNGMLRCSAYSPDNYELFCWNADTFHNGNKYTIVKNGSLTAYSVELKNGYAVLKEYGSTVSYHNSDNNSRTDNYNTQSTNKSSEGSLLWRLLFYAIQILMFVYFPPLSFNRFLKDALYKQNKSLKHLLAVFIGLAGWGFMLYMFSAGALAPNMLLPMIVLAIIYVILNVINLIVFIFANQLVKFFSTEKKIKITFWIYMAVLIFIIVSMGAWYGLLLNSMMTM